MDLDALKGEAGFLLPTDTFQGRASFSVGEEDFELIEAHGETHDMLIVWLPKQKVLLPGDNYYRAFPNLYTIRGTTPRPVRSWVQSLDMMRKLKPEYLVPSHTEPVFGLETVSKQLTDYRDGIQWVYVETIRGANEGKSMDELASSVGLPLHLRDNDALDELYGQIDWSVRAIYSGELGWFDGQAEVRGKKGGCSDTELCLAFYWSPTDRLYSHMHFLPSIPFLSHCSGALPPRP